MIVVNGEKVWVPSRRQDLVAGLRRMGLDEIDGRSLRSASVAELRRVYCCERARVVSDRQRQESPEEMRTFQSQSFTAWSVTD